MIHSRVQSFLHYIREISGLDWILFAFGAAYIFFFFEPVFFRTNAMQFYRYVPAAEHIGIDLKLTLSWSEYWLHPIKSPDPDGTVYPPTASLLLTPLLAVRFPVAYRIVAVGTLLGYIFMTLVFPLALFRARQHVAVPVLFCATGLISYGFQFELERGQFSVIAVSLAVLALWIFHRHVQHRYVAYFLFIVAVQLKLYPFCFIVMLIADWRDWRSNLIRSASLAFVNLVLFFSRGIAGIQAWIDGLSAWAKDPYLWVGNPSIRSAMSLALDFASKRGWARAAVFAAPIETLLISTVFLCILLIVLRMYLRTPRIFSPYLLLAVTLACLLAVAGGHDYRLALLGGPTAIVCLAEMDQDTITLTTRTRIVRRLASFTLAIAYASTLFSYMQKPYFIANNFPALFLMLLVVTFLALTYEPPVAEPAS